VVDPDTNTSDADERLSVEQIEAGGLLSATHVQRYELAAELSAGLRVLDLCCGTGYGAVRLGRSAAQVVGVDISAEAIAEARRITADQTHVSFDVGDGAEYVERLGADDVDIVVCFEGIEHVPDPQRLADALGRLARQGVRVVVSMPNSAAFAEENEFHVTDFDFRSAVGLANRIGSEPLRIDQLHADAALLIDAQDTDLGGTTDATLDADRRPDPAVVTHWVFAVNVDREAVRRARLRIAVLARPHHYGYMLALERSNRELWETNSRLGRAHVGVHDAAAARAARMREEIASLRKETAGLEERLTSAVESARLNDAMFQEARALLVDRENEIRALRQSLVRTRVPRAVYRRTRRMLRR
jgi:2-polyprenyl-3-methyl-5-hydroxy-6-metoxy-1,4-benzoquinol methylase